MKVLASAVAFLLLAALASAECVDVTSDPFKSLTPLPSSGNVQITVNLDGKPLPNAKLIVSTAGEHFLLSALADAHGVAQFSGLKPGRYHVIGMNSNDAYADILLDVPAKSQEGVSLFTLKMVNTFALPYFGGDPQRDREFFVARVAEMPAGEHFREFTGTVQDQSAASVPGAEIEIYPASTWERASLVHLTTDQDGHFSAKLPDGMYRAIIHMAGFKPYPVVFRILQDGNAKDLLVVLKVGGC